MKSSQGSEGHRMVRLAAAAAAADRPSASLRVCVVGRKDGFSHVTHTHYGTYTNKCIFLKTGERCHQKLSLAPQLWTTD